MSYERSRESHAAGASGNVPSTAAMVKCICRVPAKVGPGLALPGPGSSSGSSCQQRLNNLFFSGTVGCSSTPPLLPVSIRCDHLQQLHSQLSCRPTLGCHFTKLFGKTRPQSMHQTNSLEPLHPNVPCATCAFSRH